MQGAVENNDASYDIGSAHASVTGQTTIYVQCDDVPAERPHRDGLTLAACI